MTIPQPSPTAVPLREMSKGLRTAGLPLAARERARAADKPPTPTSSPISSTPPAIAMSAWPFEISQYATPIASSPAAHAVAVVQEGPRVPYASDTLQAAALGMAAGIEKGLMRSTFSGVHICAMRW